MIATAAMENHLGSRCWTGWSSQGGWSPLHPRRPPGAKGHSGRRPAPGRASRRRCRSSLSRPSAGWPAAEPSPPAPSAGVLGRASRGNVDLNTNNILKLSLCPFRKLHQPWAKSSYIKITNEWLVYTVCVWYFRFQLASKIKRDRRLLGNAFKYFCSRRWVNKAVSSVCDLPESLRFSEWRHRWLRDAHNSN